jgi:hypothetical protein
MNYLASTVKTLPSSLTKSVKAITLPQYPTIEAVEAKPQQPPVELGEIATAYLKLFAEQPSTTDKKFGIHERGGKLYIGKTEIILNGSNITLVGDGGKTYTSTPEL